MTTAVKNITGARAAVQALERLIGKDPFFGHHGGAILPFYEALAGSTLMQNYIHVPHEQIGGHAAQGVAASTNKPGIAIATSGPGATNLVTPVYDAMMDSVPILAITGDVSTAVSGSMAFQEAPVREIFRPITKAVFYVTDAGKVAETIIEAYRLAQMGRPGPVVVDIPKDVQLAQTVPFDTKENLETIVKKQAPDWRLLDQLLQLITKSKQPVLYVGGGVKSADASQELAELVRRTGIPVTYTLKGKGAFPDSDSMNIGPLGMHGSVTANYAVDVADLLIAVGARFDDRVTGNPDTFAPNAKIAQIDIDPRGIGPKGRQPQLVIKGDAREALRYLAGRAAHPEAELWHRQIKEWKEKFPFRYKMDDVIKPQYVLEQLNETLKKDPRQKIVATDVGQHQMWAMQYVDVSNPLGFLTSGGAGTMGYSMPAAMGAKLANPDSLVVAIVGEESFRMTSQTLELLPRHGICLQIIVLDNKAPDGTPGGMVRQWYDLAHNGTRVNVPDAVNPPSIAKGYGVPGTEVRLPEQVSAAIAKAISSPHASVTSFKVDPFENVYPMIPAGKSVKEMIY